MISIPSDAISTRCLSSGALNLQGNEQCYLAAVNSVSQKVAEYYEAAPAPEQSRILEHLLTPLSLLSLVAVANGVFADILFRSGSQMLPIRIEDAQNVRIDDVIALVDHVQQVRVESIESLSNLFKACT